MGAHEKLREAFYLLTDLKDQLPIRLRRLAETIQDRLAEAEEHFPCEMDD